MEVREAVSGYKPQASATEKWKVCRMRRVVVLATAIMLLPLLANCGHTKPATVPQSQETLGASWAEAYDSLPEMSKHADAIVVGTVAGVVGTEIKDDTPYTDYSVTVTRWISAGSAAEAAQRVVQIHQTGGPTTAGSIETVEEDPLLATGDTNVLFLKRYAVGKYFVLGGPTGRLVINDDVVTPLPAGIARDGLPAKLSVVVDKLTSSVSAMGKARSKVIKP